MNKIDISKPLQLAVGEKVTFSTKSFFEGAASIEVIRSSRKDLAGGKQRHWFRLDGRHVHGGLPDLQNVTEVAPKVDWTKPIELVDGTPVSFTGMTYGGRYKVAIPAGARKRAGGISRSLRSGQEYTAEGKHFYKVDQDVRNVPSVSLDITKPIQRRHGAPVKFVSKLEDGRLLFADGTFGDHLFTTSPDGRVLKTPGVESADDVINVPPAPTFVFTNVYADGTFGSSVHHSLKAAMDNSKYGKVRVGILQRKFVAGKLVGADMLPTEALKRTRENPKGEANPWA